MTQEFVVLNAASPTPLEVQNEQEKKLVTFYVEALILLHHGVLPGHANLGTLTKYAEYLESIQKIELKNPGIMRQARNRAYFQSPKKARRSWDELLFDVKNATPISC